MSIRLIKVKAISAGTEHGVKTEQGVERNHDRRQSYRPETCKGIAGRLGRNSVSVRADGWGRFRRLRNAHRWRSTCCLLSSEERCSRRQRTARPESVLHERLRYVLRAVSRPGTHRSGSAIGWPPGPQPAAADRRHQLPPRHRPSSIRRLIRPLPPMAVLHNRVPSAIFVPQGSHGAEVNESETP